MKALRLGVNIDHIATLRNARGGIYPDLIRACEVAMNAGAHSITAHLREDRRHIKDQDIKAIKDWGKLPLNFEMAATQEMEEIVLKTLPFACCIVPEKRQERTTEGGLAASAAHNILKPMVSKLKNARIRVSLFIEADEKEIKAASEIGANAIEFHTGSLCDAITFGENDKAQKLLADLQKGASFAASLGLEVHAGHGIDFNSVVKIAAIPEIEELNIGHFLVSEGVFIGFENSIQKMADLMQRVRV